MERYRTRSFCNSSCIVIQTRPLNRKENPSPSLFLIIRLLSILAALTMIGLTINLKQQVQLVLLYLVTVLDPTITQIKTTILIPTATKLSTAAVVAMEMMMRYTLKHPPRWMCQILRSWSIAWRFSCKTSRATWWNRRRSSTEADPAVRDSALLNTVQIHWIY